MELAYYPTIRASHPSKPPLIQTIPSISTLKHAQPCPILHSTHINYPLRPHKSLGFPLLMRPKRVDHLLLPHCTQTPKDYVEQARRAFETAPKLYNAVKNGDLWALASLTGVFFPIFLAFSGNLGMLDLFSSLMGLMGSHIEFLIKPMKDGTDVGVKLLIEGKTNHGPFGQGFGIYTTHYYQGKVYIRNVKKLIEPLLDMEPLKLKMVELITPILDKIDPDSFLKGKRRLAFIYYLLGLILITIFSAY